MKEPTRKRSATLELKFSSDPQWHGTGTDKWYFSGPYYCHSAKFRYRTPGVPVNTQLKFRVLLGAVVLFEKTVTSSQNWKDVPFNGDLNKAVPANKNYLEPLLTHKARLLDPAAGGLGSVEIKFSVKKRTIWWLDTQEDGSNATPDGVGTNVRAIARKWAPSGANISDDVDSDAEILLLEHSAKTWKDAYSYLTVAAMFYSVGHGARQGVGANAKYGAVYLPVNTTYKGFGAGTNFPNVQPYAVSALGLWDLEVWLKHCWTADSSPNNGPSVAKTLDDILEQGVGASKTYGYEGLYKNKIELRSQFTGSRCLPPTPPLPPDDIKAKLDTLLPNEDAFVKPPFNGDPSKVDLDKVRRDLQDWAKNTYGKTSVLIDGVGFKVAVDEPGNSVVMY
jgi:hypothetical protein